MHYAIIAQTLFYKPDNSDHVAQRSKAVSSKGVPLTQGYNCQVPVAFIF